MKTPRKRWFWAIVAMIFAAAISGGALWWKRSNDPRERGRAAYEKGLYDEAASWARKTLDDQPNDKAALRLLARARQAREKRIGHRHLSRAVARPESHAGRRLFFDRSRLDRGRRAERRKACRDQAHEFAIAAFEEARSLDPRHAETLVELIKFYTKYDILSQVGPLCEALAAVPGHEAEGRVFESRNDLSLFELDAAAKQLDQALLDRPREPNAVRKLLARTYLRLGNPNQAKQTLQPLIDIGKDAETYWIAARIELQRKRPSKRGRCSSGSKTWRTNRTRSTADPSRAFTSARSVARFATRRFSERNKRAITPGRSSKPTKSPRSNCPNNRSPILRTQP